MSTRLAQSIVQIKSVSQSVSSTSKLL